MKFLNKTAMLTLLLGVTLTVPTFASTNAELLNSKSTNSDNLVTDKNSAYVGIKKVENSSNELTSKNVEGHISQLPDGVYVVNRGTGWVLGEDKSLLTTAIINSGTTSRMIINEAVQTKHAAIAGAEVSFSYKFVKAAIQTTYEYAINEREAITSGYVISAPADKNIYAKVYATYNRFDTIKVESGKIVEHSVTYSPDGTWLRIKEYSPGEVVNQSLLEEKVDRSILGESSLINVKNTINIGGTTYDGDAKTAFRLLLDYNTQKLVFAGKTSDQIHAGFRDLDYFEFTLLGSNFKEKQTFVFKGTDSPTDTKFNALDGLRFNLGDYILLGHKETFRVGINNLPENITWENEKALFEITNDGLKQVPLKTLNDAKNNVQSDQSEASEQVQATEQAEANEQVQTTEQAEASQQVQTNVQTEAVQTEASQQVQTNVQVNPGIKYGPGAM